QARWGGNVRVFGRAATAHVEVLARDLEGIHEVELLHRIEDQRVVVAQRGGPDVTREIEEYISVGIRTEWSFGGGGVVPDEIVDIGTRRGAFAVIVGPFARAFSG